MSTGAPLRSHISHYDIPRFSCGYPPNPWIETPAIIQGQSVGDAANLYFVPGVGVGVRIGGNFFLEDQFVLYQGPGSVGYV